MKTRYFIFLSYKGTSYHGWQVQPGSVTIQQIVDKALTLITGEKISTTGAGRTDTGVHASFFCAHFDSSRPDLAENKNMIFRLNRYLPADIAVKSLKKVKPDASARYNAISRTYRYYISRTKEPFSTEFSVYIHGDIDIDSMNEAARILTQQSDFSSFCRLHSDNKTNICRVLSAGWETEGNKLVFKIKADRFLRNMVRAVVGTMLEIGKGKITVDNFMEIIMAKDRSAAGTSAPAKGLFLTDIEYPEEIYL